MNEKVLIVGAGMGLSASIARLCSSEGMEVALAARNIDKLVSLKKEINAKTFKCDASDINEVSSLFRELDQSFGIPNLVIYNPSSRIRGAIGDLDPKETQEAINITCFGGFLVAQEASKRMLKNKKGSIFFTGASASIKGFANSSVFAMGKFGLRGLAQSLARELHPQNIHIGHFIIDGGIGKSSTGYKLINPDSIANTYLEVHKQDSSAWTWEVELRTNKETF
jgi:short-subunit dehydrogenase|tara:strand:- start:2952 stop:3623 length:672 start_codon:yes stop_codon:yes gene_type:complete